MRKLKIIFPIMALLFAVLACGKSSETEELKSGKLSFVKKLRYGSVGTHGSQGWYVDDRFFLVNGKKWAPEEIKVDDIAGCDASPNQSVEALKCYCFADLKESVFILRMNADMPEWITALDSDYRSGKNLGEWTGDGHWVIFIDFYFNVETSEKRAIKGLPDFPEERFRGNSPDMEMILYEESYSRYDLPPDAPNRKEKEAKQYKIFFDRSSTGISAFWIIDSKTGSHTDLELKRDKYDWLTWNKEKLFATRSDWLDYFRKQLVWGNDKAGHFRLVYPN